MYTERRADQAGGVLWTSTQGAEATRVLPDGCSDLLWMNERLWVAGPDTRAHLSSGQVGRRLGGLRFDPGLAPVVFGVSAHEVADRRVPLEDLWPAAEVRRLSDEIGSAGELGAALEDVATRLVRRSGPAEPVVVAVAELLGRGSSVADVANGVGYSERQLRRRCMEAFGYGPKHFARVLRMNRALGLARGGMALAAVAAVAGYADQAHLARDVRDLAGVPMTALRYQYT